MFASAVYSFAVLCS